MRRPWKERIWFYRPGQYHNGLVPFGRGGDEYLWSTIVIGWLWTGVIVIATRFDDSPSEWIVNLDEYPG